jgi:hypothetical protein
MDSLLLPMYISCLKELLEVINSKHASVRTVGTQRTGHNATEQRDIMRVICRSHLAMKSMEVSLTLDTELHKVRNSYEISAL